MRFMVGKRGSKGSPEERFWGKVKKASGCWLWHGSCWQDGYGRFFFTPPKAIKAHRFSWEIHHGPIPRGLSVLHRCDVRNCVNPKHLSLGTYGDNARDMVSKQRHVKLHGSLHPNTKLSVIDVNQIRALYKSGITQVSLAKQFGIEQPAISKIILRQTWRRI